MGRVNLLLVTRFDFLVGYVHLFFCVCVCVLFWRGGIEFREARHHWATPPQLV